MSNDSQFPFSEFQDEELSRNPLFLTCINLSRRTGVPSLISSAPCGMRAAALNLTMRLHTKWRIPSAEQFPEEPVRADYFPWRSVLALFLALGAQSYIGAAKPSGKYCDGVVYPCDGDCVIWAYFKDEWHLPALPVFRQTPDDLSTRADPISLFHRLCVARVLEFWPMNLFTPVNLALWLLSLGFLFYALWLKLPKSCTGFKS